jgi:hypothetical protein
MVGRRRYTMEGQGQHTASPCDHTTNMRHQSMRRRSLGRPRIMQMAQAYGLTRRQTERRVYFRLGIPPQCPSQQLCQTILVYSLRCHSQLLAGRVQAIYILNTQDHLYQLLRKTSTLRDRQMIGLWNKSF